MKHDVVDKKHFRDFVLELIYKRLSQIQNFAEFTVEASQDIKKTPKYDSIREEVQNEIYQLDKKVHDFREMQKLMKKVVYSPSNQVQWGAVVFTNKARFYLSVSLGEFYYKNDRFYAISMESPLAQKMLGLQEGDHISLNGIQQKIIEIL